MDISSIIKLINTNNDNIIQKSEVEAYLKQNTSPSIFTEYFSSIQTNTDIKVFENELINISSSNQNSVKTAQAKLKSQFYDNFYQGYGYRFRSDEDFETAFNQAAEFACKTENIEESFYNKFAELIPDITKIPQIELMERINSGKFSYICNDFQKIVFEDVDLSKYEEAFKRISFNEKTFAKVSPEHLPKGFNPQEVLEKGKTIGLGIDEVHNMGYTGEGVSYAIIDSGVTPHNDLKIKEYNIAESAKDWPWLNHFHGSAVSYIAQEIAPDADCYYYATYNGGEMDKPVLENLKSILEKNKRLPENQKIRFVSMSMPLYGGEEAKQVAAELEAQGVWVYYSGCPEDHNSGYLEKIDPNGDPDDFNNYQISAGRAGDLYVNSGSRTVPDPSSPDAYRHDSPASQSWSIPVIAGYYTLACQADPSMTKERFMELAEQTAQIKQSTEPNWVCIGSNNEDENSWIKQGRSTDTVEIKIIDIKALLQAIEAEKQKQEE